MVVGFGLAMRTVCKRCTRFKPHFHDTFGCAMGLARCNISPLSDTCPRSYSVVLLLDGVMLYVNPSCVI